MSIWLFKKFCKPPPRRGEFKAPARRIPTDSNDIFVYLSLIRIIIHHIHVKICSVWVALVLSWCIYLLLHWHYKIILFNVNIWKYLRFEVSIVGWFTAVWCGSKCVWWKTFLFLIYKSNPNFSNIGENPKSIKFLVPQT